MKIGDRIKVLEIELGKPGNTLGKQAGLGNKTVDRWMDRPIEFNSAPLEKFISYHNINKEWWVTGEGAIFNKSVSRIDLYEKLVESEKESKSIALQNAERWHQEALRLGELLRLALSNRQ